MADAPYLLGPDDLLLQPPALPWEQDPLIPPPQTEVEQAEINTTPEVPAPVAPEQPDPFLAAMNPTGAFGLHGSQLDSPALEQAGALPEAPVADVHGAFTEQFGGQPDLDAEIDNQLAGGLEAPQAAFDPNPGQLTPEEGAELLHEQGPQWTAEYAARLEDERNREGLEKAEAALKADAATEERHRLARDEAVATARQRSEMLWRKSVELAQREVDPDRWWEGRSTGQQIELTISAGIGGLLNPGGPNSTIAAIENAINRDIDAQKANIVNGRATLEQQFGLVNQFMTDTENIHAAAEAARVAAFKRTADQIAIEQQKYDPAGTTAARLAQMRFDAEAKAAEAARKLAKEELDFEDKRVRLQIAQQTEERSAWKDRQDVARNWAGQKLDRDRLTLDRDKFDAEKNAPPKPQDVQAALELEQAQRGDVMTDSQGAVLGKPRAKSEEERGRLRNTVASYETFRPLLTDLLNQVKTLGTTYGGVGSQRWSGEERAEYESLRRQLGEILGRVRQPTGILTESDIERGAKDIPSVDSWTAKSNPDAVYKSLTKVLDHDFDTKMKVHLEGYDPAKGPTARAKAADQVITAGTPSAASPEQLMQEATTPLWSGATESEKRAHAARLSGIYKAIEERTDGGPEQIKALANAYRGLQAQRDALTPDEYTSLEKKLLDAINRPR